MFDSQESWTAAGFKVKRRSENDKIMVGTHPSVPGYLFKKYGRSVRCDDQRENYRERVRGADAIRALVEQHKLDKIVVVHKWIYELPAEFKTRKRCPELLVAERVDLVRASEAKRLYSSIDPATLEQLCRVLHAFSGFDAAVHNLKFTSGGQIAFYDTESWNRSPRSADRVLRHLSEELTRESKKIAFRAFDRFDRE